MSSGPLPFVQVDVFTDRPLAGNALCVFPDAEDLAPETMQAIARETNLSETTFVLPATAADADYRVRIFTPTSELPFAGHPTLGTAAVLSRLGRLPAGSEGRIVAVQETAAGLTRLTVETVTPAGAGKTAAGAFARVEMTAPLPAFEHRVEAAEVARALAVDPAIIAGAGLPCELFAAGIRHLIVPIRDLDALAALRPDTAALVALSHRLGCTGAFCFTPQAPRPGVAARARLFAPAHGIAEDPATGSAAGPLGSYFARHGLLPGGAGEAAFAFEQGVEIGRPSLLRVAVARDASGLVTEVRVGGEVCAVAEGRYSV